MSIDRLKSDTEKANESSVKSRTIDVDLDFNQWVTFYINGELYAIDAIKVREVLNYNEITPVPSSPKYVVGLINLRGKVVTVINTRILFSLPSTDPDENSNIILVDFSEDEMVGFVVDSVDEVMNILAKSIEASPKSSDIESARGFVKGVTFQNKKMVICLEANQLIDYINPDV